MITLYFMVLFLLLSWDKTRRSLALIDSWFTIMMLVIGRSLSTLMIYHHLDHTDSDNQKDLHVIVRSFWWSWWPDVEQRARDRLGDQRDQSPAGGERRSSDIIKKSLHRWLSIDHQMIVTMWSWYSKIAPFIVIIINMTITTKAILFL